MFQCGVIEQNDLGRQELSTTPGVCPAPSHRTDLASMFPACPTCGKPMTAEAARSFRCEPCREIIRFFEVSPKLEFRQHGAIVAVDRSR